MEILSNGDTESDLSFKYTGSESVQKKKEKEHE
jgi:hypothetical protein